MRVSLAAKALRFGRSYNRGFESLTRCARRNEMANTFGVLYFFGLLSIGATFGYIVGNVLSSRMKASRRHTDSTAETFGMIAGVLTLIFVVFMGIALQIDLSKVR